MCRPATPSSRGVLFSWDNNYTTQNASWVSGISCGAQSWSQTLIPFLGEAYSKLISEADTELEITFAFLYQAAIMVNPGSNASKCSNYGKSLGFIYSLQDGIYSKMVAEILSYDQTAGAVLLPYILSWLYHKIPQVRALAILTVGNAIASFPRHSRNLITLLIDATAYKVFGLIIRSRPSKLPRDAKWWSSSLLLVPNYGRN